MSLFGRKKDAGQLVAEGVTLLQSGKMEEAAAKLRQATEADPKHAQAWYCLGTIYSGAGQLKLAIGCYQKSVQHAPADKQALPLFNLGNALQGLGQVDEALKVFTLVTKVDPQMADAWINRGRLLDDAGNHAQAIECYDTALALVSDDVVALANRGNSLRSLNRFAEAKASYEAALAIEPNNPASLNGLGQCLSSLGKPDQGLLFVDKALQIARFPEVLAERAIILAKLGRLDEALASTDEAIRKGLRNPQVYNNRGEMLARLSKVDESVASFDEALKLNPRYSPAHFGKARTLCNAKRFASAKAAIDLYFASSDGSDNLGEAAKAVVSLCQDGLK